MNDVLTKLAVYSYFVGLTIYKPLETSSAQYETEFCWILEAGYRMITTQFDTRANVIGMSDLIFL